MKAKRQRSFFDYPYPIPFAHRGGSDKYPENTLAAFRHAYKLGYRYFETDVHYTSDGELVAFHDSDLERTLGLKGKISDITRDQRKTILLGNSHQVPLLSDLLELFPEAYFNIDAKMAESVLPLAATIKEHQAEGRVCLASFSAQAIKELRRLLPNVPTVATRYEIARLRYGLPFTILPEQDTHFLEMPAYLLHNKQRLPIISNSSVARLHDKGCKVYIWTVNEETEMHRLLDMNIDGIFTDNLSGLKRVLMDRKQWL